MDALRRAVIKLAHEIPGMREHLVPVLRKTSDNRLEYQSKVESDRALDDVKERRVDFKLATEAYQKANQDHLRGMDRIFKALEFAKVIPPDDKTTTFNYSWGKVTLVTRGKTISGEQLTNVLGTGTFENIERGMRHLSDAKGKLLNAHFSLGEAIGKVKDLIKAGKMDSGYPAHRGVSLALPPPPA